MPEGLASGWLSIVCQPHIWLYHHIEGVWHCVEVLRTGRLSVLVGLSNEHKSRLDKSLRYITILLQIGRASCRERV